MIPDEMKKAIGDIFYRKEQGEREFPPVGKLSDEDKARVKVIYGTSMIQSLGENLYHIGGGCITGEGGWDKFCEEVKKSCLEGFKGVL